MKYSEQDVRMLIKKRVLRLTAAVLLLALTDISAILAQLIGHAESAFSTDFYISGIVAIGALYFYYRRKYSRVLRNKETLEAYWIKQTDERNTAIALNTSTACFRLTLLLLGISGVVSSFFSRTVTMTIGYIIIGIVILYAGLRLYYSKKY